MPVHVERRAGKYRIIEPNGHVAETPNGNPRDGGGHSTKEMADRQARVINANIKKSDARTLYVYRKVRNANDIVSWAKANGFDKTVPLDDLHVTVAFSKTKLDWGYLEPANNRVTNHLIPGRSVTRLGDKGAIVLKFRSAMLSQRWRYFKSAGASWDWPGYQPHITITYKAVPKLIIDDISPFEGPIVLGAEIFSEIIDSWEDTITEKCR